MDSIYVKIKVPTADHNLIITQFQTVSKISQKSKLCLNMNVSLGYNVLCVNKSYIFHCNLLQTATFLLLYPSHRYIYFNIKGLCTHYVTHKSSNHTKPYAYHTFNDFHPVVCIYRYNNIYIYILPSDTTMIF
jgi:hypothetical protein